MTREEFIKSTAAGLRKMDIKPDYLLLIADRFDDWEYDEFELCGIPVIKSFISVNNGYSDMDYPIVPCFKNGVITESQYLMQISYFQRGFYEQ